MNMPILPQFAEKQKTIEIDGAVIRQDQYGRFHLNDLHIASGGLDKNKPSNFLRQDQIQALVTEIERCSDVSNGIKAVESIRGGLNQGTYAVKQVVYAYAMWISPSFNLKVINTFDAVATGSMQPAKELSRMEILQIAMESEKENIALRGELAIVTPKAQALDVLSNSHGTETVDNCAHAMGIQPRKTLRPWMEKNNWIHKDKDGQWRAKSERITAGHLKEASRVITDTSGTPRHKVTVYVTPKGKTLLTTRLIQAGIIKGDVA